MRPKFKFGFVFVLLMAFISLMNPKQAQAAPLASPTTRLAGYSQIDTAIAVSKNGWERADTVLIANAWSYSDALVAAPLAHKLDAPILLTEKNGVSAKILDELRRLGAKRAILLGGTAVLEPKVQQDLSAVCSVIERIDGYDRYETAAKVAERVGVKGQVILVNGQQFKDALAVSSYAAITETPVLLANTLEIPKYTRDETLKLLNQALAKEGGAKTIVVGGEAVVPTGVLKGLPGGIQRIAGWDQYETAADVYTTFQNVFSSNTAYLVSGENFPDALVAGPLAARNLAGIFMSAKAGLPAQTYSALRAAAESADGLQVTMVGGTAVLSDTVKGMVEGKIQPDYLLAGLTVAVDPGHGGPDPGAIGVSGTPEKVNNLAVGLNLAGLLRQAGATVILTRSTDSAPSGAQYAEKTDLQTRVAMANDGKADLFVSIHQDSYIETSTGTTTYFSSSHPDAANSQTLANKVQPELVKALGFYNRGVKDKGYFVLVNTKMPAILVELGFISNPAEEALLNSSEYQQRAAKAIYLGILAFKGY